MGFSVQIRFDRFCMNIDTCLCVSVFDSSRLNLSQTMSSDFGSTFSIPSFAIFLYVFLLFTHSLFIEATCYYPDGTIATQDIPCTKDTTVNADYCCGSDSICLTNKICLNNIGTLVRGSCTDHSWTSPSCPSFCVSGKLISSSAPHLPTDDIYANHRKSTRRRRNDCVPAAVFRILVLYKVQGR